MPDNDIENFDPTRIPDTENEGSFHADATYVFTHLATKVIPQFNVLLDWIEGALDGVTQTVLDSLNAIFDGSADKIGAAEITWGGGQHRLTDNDGGGNANVRFGHYYDEGERVSQAGGSGVQLEAAVDVGTPTFSIDLFGSGAATGALISSLKKLELSGTGDFTWGGEKVWHAGNHGDGSGLDADLLRGVAGDKFARRDAPNSFAESTTFGSTVFVGESGVNGVIQFYDLTNDAYRGLHFHPGIEDWRMEDKNGVYRRVWHAGNDGANSGLDADLLDGLQGHQFVRVDQNSTIAAGLAVEQVLTVGASGEGGSVINFYDDNSNTTRTLMWNDVYNNWQVEDNSGVLHEMLHAGNADFVDKGLGIASVESYVFAEGYAANPGNTKAGSGLDYSSTNSNPYTSTSLSGTWRCHGYASGASYATLWKRTA